MPRVDVEANLRAATQLTDGLEGGLGVRQASLLRKAVYAIRDELPVNFTRLSDNRFVYTAADKINDYPWDQGGIWQQVASPDGRQLLVREDKIPELEAAGMIQSAGKSEPPEYWIPPEVATDKLHRLDDKAEDRDLPQQETELQTRLQESLEYKGLES